MRYCKIISFVGLLFMTLHALQAQENYTSLSVGLGQFLRNPVSGSVNYTFFSNKDISQVSRFSPQLSLNLETFISKKWTLGLQLQYVKAESERDTRTTGSIFGNSRFIENVTSNAIGGELNFKYFYYQKDEYSLYMVGQAGVFLAVEKSTTSGAITISTVSTWLSLNAGTGIRYFFNNKLGMFGELSYRRLGPPHSLHFNAGLIFKI
jgi:hypothetical protein